MVDTKRKSYLDILRILACFLVIFNHVPGYELYQSARGATQWVYMVISMFTRINVPIFFMISGALLLSREEPLSKVLKHRAARIAAVTVIFSTVLYIVRDPWAANLRDWLKGILRGDISFAYWYLYAYLGLLVMLPFLRKIAKEFGRQEFFYLLALHVVLCVLWPMASSILFWLKGEKLRLSGDFAVPLATAKAFFYPLMGYYLDRVFRVETMKKKDVILLSGAAVLGLLLTSVFTYAEGVVGGEFTENFTDLFVWLTAMAVFVVTKYLLVTSKKQMGDRAARCLAFASSLTFGIYLLDPLLQHWIFWPFIQSPSMPALPVMVTSLMWCAFSMLAGGGLTYLLKKLSILL